MKKILIVEDEVHIIKILTFALKNDQVEIISETNGNNVLELINTEKPDVVLLDLMIPGKSGFDILSELHRNNTVSTTNIIIISARYEEKDVAYAKALGAKEFLTKPFEVMDLIDLVNHYKEIN